MNGADTMIATLVKIFNDIAYAEGHTPKKKSGNSHEMYHLIAMA